MTQTLKQHVRSCHTDNSTEKKCLYFTHKQLTLQFFRNCFIDILVNIPVSRVIHHSVSVAAFFCTQFWVKTFLYPVLFLLKIYFFPTFSTTSGPSHSYFIPVFLHDFYSSYTLSTALTTKTESMACFCCS